MLIITFLFLFVGPGGQFGINKIAEFNQKLATGNSAYSKGDFKTAEACFAYIQDSLLIKDNRIGLNLANCYIKLGKVGKAKEQLNLLTENPDQLIRSIAYNQLGLVFDKDAKQALSCFKQALKINPQNPDARHNFEVLARKHPEIEPEKLPPPPNKQNKEKDKKENKEKDKNEKQSGKPESDQKNDKQNSKNNEGDAKGKKDSDKKKNEGSDKKDGKGDDSQPSEDGKNEQAKDDTKGKNNGQPKGNGEEDESGKNVVNKGKLKEMNLSAEGAKMLLDAMKNNEVQYLQQRQKTRKSMAFPDSKRPDW